MLKLVYCIRRRDDISPENFYRYWLQDHAPKVRGVAEAIGAVRYVQSHTCLPEMNAEFESGRGTQPAYDGITEVWFRDEDHMNAAMASPAGEEAGRFLVSDESTFIDFAQSRVFMTREHEIFDFT
ncbi:MAG: EthD family reductase [Rhizobiales bacterium TMED83]|jgi:uncharacterized protein (TIGR02118 family)|nr:hypothetical protein [Rhodobiaceae bacterium]RPF93509.1 MAG: EthD family reductase [Rhizobiales bacterium TMED83]HCD16366.1 EthD family reductase [Rhodobiaceae bacterium]|tara:strand:- start:108 stop:482 length:375 start_codon:yes stop_codon:yes gene_type:complete